MKIRTVGEFQSEQCPARLQLMRPGGFSPSCGSAFSGSRSKTNLTCHSICNWRRLYVVALPLGSLPPTSPERPTLSSTVAKLTCRSHAHQIGKNHAETILRGRRTIPELSHEQLWRVCKRLPGDYEPYGDTGARDGRLLKRMQVVPHFEGTGRLRLGCLREPEKPSRRTLNLRASRLSDV